jgi:hypothetical protein
VHCPRAYVVTLCTCCPSRYYLCDNVVAEADVYNASLPKLHGNVFEQQLQAKLLIEGIRLVDGVHT